MKKRTNSGIYTEDMGPPPQDIDGASVTPPAPKAAPASKTPAKRVPEKATDKRPARSGGIFREGMPIPQEPDDASVRYAKGGSVSASRRADGCAQRGKTKGRML